MATIPTGETNGEITKARVEGIIEAYRAKDMNALLSLYVDEDLEFSDYRSQDLNLTKDELKARMIVMFAMTEEMKLTTRTLKGDKSFMAWEWETEIIWVGGKVKRMKGITLSWWMEVGDGEVKEWKCWRERSYGR